MFLAGSICVVVAGYLLSAEARHSWLRAVMPPSHFGLGGVGKWISYLNLMAAAMFVGGSVLGFVYDDLSLRQWRIGNALTWILGSCLLVCKSALLFLETMNPRW